MIKKMMALILISFICLSLSASVGATTPEDIKDALNKDLSHWRQQMQTLTTHSKQGIQTNTFSDDKTTSSYLGDGYAKYNINLSSYSAFRNTYVSSTNDSLLRFTGYVFLVEGKSGSIALAFADDLSNDKEITGLASSESFSDADFKIPMEKAKQLVGFNASSKLIYDEAHRTIALVTTTDQGEKVALLEDSSPLGLKKYDVLSFEELIAKVQNFEAEQAQQASFTNDPTSGGGGGFVNSGGGTGNVQAAIDMFTDKPSRSPSFIWFISSMILIGFVYFLIYRKYE